jgi:hypothetical protein
MFVLLLKQGNQQKQNPKQVQVQVQTKAVIAIDSIIHRDGHECDALDKPIRTQSPVTAKQSCLRRGAANHRCTQESGFKVGQ